ncbi:MAG: hypothetical protein WBD99_16370 [Thermodesulfobacteriota bacterium]
MPELDSHIFHRRLGAGQKTSIAYGDQLIEERSPNDYPYTDTGSWPSFQQSLTGAPFRITAAVYQEAEDTLIIEWSENEDPFTQADLLDVGEKKVQELIFRIRTSLSIPYREMLANRLLTLFNDAKEEDPASVGIAVGSLRNFYDFLRTHTNLTCPVLSLTPDNNIYASWRGEHNRMLSVHFLTNGDVRFVMFSPNFHHPEKQIRISGIATTDTLMETVARDGLLDWIGE